MFAWGIWQLCWLHLFRWYSLTSFSTFIKSETAINMINCKLSSVLHNLIIIEHFINRVELYCDLMKCRFGSFFSWGENDVYLGFCCVQDMGFGPLLARSAIAQHGTVQQALDCLLAGLGKRLPSYVWTLSRVPIRLIDTIKWPYQIDAQFAIAIWM